MRNLRRYLTFAAITAALIILLSGCAVGIKPRSNDVPPDENVYYEESGYDSSYSTTPRYSGSYYQDPGYDPWTMGAYYQQYSGSPGSSSGTANTQSTNNRPTVKDRNSTSAVQSQAPADSSTSSLKRSRSSIRERREATSQISESASQKVKRDTSRQSSQENKADDDTTQKQRRTETQRISSQSSQKQTESTKEEEEKNKQKRSSR